MKKITIIALIIILIGIGYILTMSENIDTTESPIVDSNTITTKERTPDSDAAYQKLLRDEQDVKSNVNITGYYKTIERSVWDETVNCDVLVVTGGDEDIIEKYISNIINGNMVQLLNENGDLLLNLPTNIPQNDLSTIKKTTVDNKITIILDENKPIPKDVSGCHSFFTYISSEI